VQGFKNWCTETGRKLSPIQAEIMDLLALDEGEYYIQWTRGHSNDVGNILADQLASTALISTIADQIPLETGFFQRRGRQTLLEPPQEAPRLSHLKRQELPKGIIRSMKKASGELRRFIGRIATNHFRDRFSWSSSDSKGGCCRRFGLQYQTVEHFTRDCEDSFVQESRLQALGKNTFSLRHILIRPRLWSKLKELLQVLEISV